MASGRSLTLVLGGARSGKSRFAEERVRGSKPPWTYIATYDRGDSADLEMAARIASHQAQRGTGWVTLETPLDLAMNLQLVPRHGAVLVDCLTLFLTNHILRDADIDAVSAELLEVLAKPAGPWVLVANEVGLGIVPDNALARRFRDAAGRLNQQVAAIADEVFFMVAGLPMKVK